MSRYSGKQDFSGPLNNRRPHNKGVARHTRYLKHLEAEERNAETPYIRTAQCRRDLEVVTKGGHIVDAMMESLLAEEAEAGYDPQNLVPRPPKHGEVRMVATNDRLITKTGAESAPPEGDA